MINLESEPSERGWTNPERVKLLAPWPCFFVGRLDKGRGRLVVVAGGGAGGVFDGSRIDRLSNLEFWVQWQHGV